MLSDAKNNLIKQYAFSEKQAEAIVMLQLYRLTNTDIVSLQEEKAELEKRVQRLNEIFESDDVLRQVIIIRLKEIRISSSFLPNGIFVLAFIDLCEIHLI